MSLLEQMMEPCILLNKIKEPDGQGGSNTTWADGPEIMVAIVHNNSIQAKVAESQGVTSTYTLTTNKANALDFHDVIRRKSDGLILRVTTDAGDVKSPTVSSLDIAQVNAEKWSLPV